MDDGNMLVDLLDDDDAGAPAFGASADPWIVLVVDDDESVHRVTSIALARFSFEGRPLQLVHCRSGVEAVAAVRAHPGAALMLLDVVMETEDAGLRVVRQVREDIGNSNIRIVLRTGQPGQAPEARVIAEYDINDYKEKTEVTAQKLHTTVYAALRSFRDVMALDLSRQGLEQVIEASGSIFEQQSLENFARGVLHQLSALLSFQNGGGGYCTGSGLAESAAEGLRITIASGQFEKLSGQTVAALQPSLFKLIKRAVMKRELVFQDQDMVAYFQSGRDADNVAFLTGAYPVTDLHRRLLEIFCRNVSVAFDNIRLKQEIEDTQREIVYRLSEAVESRSKETGNHVKRVAEYARILARGIGIDEAEADLIRLAAPLHDVGKIGIPDAILNKPGKHTPEEWDVMKTHAAMGYEMLRDAGREVFSAGAMIARDHHEKWDGTGYPNNLAGKDIHVYGRIVALADVFDALGSARCYKPAWEYNKVKDYLVEQSGRQFDPELVKVFADREAEMLAVRDRYVD